MKKFTKQKESMFMKYIRFLSLTFMVVLTTTLSTMSEPTEVLNLRSMEDFVVLAGSTVTAIPPVSLDGNVGLSPAAGSYIVGFDGSNVNGILYVVDASGPAGSVIDATLLTTAKGDLTTAYNDAAGRTPVPTGPFLNPNGGNIGGLNLVPGLYKFTSTCLITGGHLTLTGSASDVWIFQIASNLDMGNNVQIILAGGARASNIFWQVGTSATVGTYTAFKGTILADQSISFGTGATLDGRALAFSGAVTMASDMNGNKPISTFPIFSVNPTELLFGNVKSGTTKKDSVTVTNIGTADLIIDSVKSSNGLFTVTPMTGTIAPTASRKFYVTFAPIADSLKTGYIYFYHNGDNKMDSIRVSGTGVSPMFTVAPMSLDFGNVDIGLTKTDSVLVTNNGTSVLIISIITSSNTVFTIAPTFASVNPGDSRKFYITFEPLTDSLKTGYISFYHNALNGKDSIPVSGTGIAPKFTVDPLRLDFGEVNTASTEVDSVTVTNNGTADLIITSITSSNDHYTLLELNATIQPGESKKFYVTFTPITEEYQEGYIYFNFNATNLRDSIYVTGTGVGDTTLPEFTITPLSLDFGTVLTGESKTITVTITNTGDANLVISGMYSGNPFYTVEQKISIITPGNTSIYEIVFSPLIPELTEGYIYFRHNAPNRLDSLFVTGIGAGPFMHPEFSINPSYLDFGTVFIGDSKLKSVLVTNTGKTTLNIKNIISENSHYSITPIIGKIEPNEYKQFFIRFTPTVEEQVNTKIIFTHNVGSDTINATGRGLLNLTVITIGEARDLPLGSEFVIEGIVTRSLGKYTRFQDGSAGLTILQESGLFFDEVANFEIQMTDKIRVRGIISEINNLKVINGDDLIGYQRISRLNILPQPVEVTLSELKNNGEQYESRLIKLDYLTINSVVSGSVFIENQTYDVVDNSDYSKSVVIRIGKGEDTEMDGLPYIYDYVTFEGVLSQNSEVNPSIGYQLTPVNPLDLDNSPLDVFERGTVNTFSLYESYPNPFTSFTTIQYNLGNSGFTTLKVYNIYGEEVATLAEGFREAGLHTVKFYVSGERLSLGSGVYFYRLQSGSFISMKQMIFVK